MTQTSVRHKEVAHKSETPPEPEGFSDVSPLFVHPYRPGGQEEIAVLVTPIGSGDLDEEAIRGRGLGIGAARDHDLDRLQVPAALIQELLVLIGRKEALHRS